MYQREERNFRMLPNALAKESLKESIQVMLVTKEKQQTHNEENQHPILTCWVGEVRMMENSRMTPTSGFNKILCHGGNIESRDTGGEAVMGESHKSTAKET